MATEEFTFPIVSADTCPSSIDSPPLWRLSPAASPDPHLQRRGKSYEEEEYCYRAKPKGYKQRKSCSDIENKGDDDDEEEEEEEKMDVLWENFNEELCNGKSSFEGYSNKSRSSRDMVELGCVEALKLSSKASNNNGAIFSSSPKNTNKPGVVVFIKVLKRLFLLHNSSHHHHHHQHHHHHHKSVTVKNMKW